MKHPMQPLVTDPHGVVRFQKNEIVSALLDQPLAGSLDLNRLATMGFSEEDHTQLAQLIGYSLAGFHELSYVSDEDALAASAAAKEAGLLTGVGGCRDEGCGLHSRGGAGLMTEGRRKAMRVNLRVCANGHAEPIPGSEHEVWLIACPFCLQWTGEDGNFCGFCGQRLKPEPAGKK